MQGPSSTTGQSSRHTKLFVMKWQMVWLTSWRGGRELVHRLYSEKATFANLPSAQKTPTVKKLSKQTEITLPLKLPTHTKQSRFNCFQCFLVDRAFQQLQACTCPKIAISSSQCCHLRRRSRSVFFWPAKDREKWMIGVSITIWKFLFFFSFFSFIVCWRR